MGKTLLKIAGIGLVGVLPFLEGCGKDSSPAKDESNKYVVSKYGDNGLIYGLTIGESVGASSTVTVADINNDSISEIIVVGRNGHIYVFENKMPQKGRVEKE